MSQLDETEVTTTGEQSGKIMSMTAGEPKDTSNPYERQSTLEGLRTSNVLTETETVSQLRKILESTKSDHTGLGDLTLTESTKANDNQVTEKHKTGSEKKPRKLKRKKQGKAGSVKGEDVEVDDSYMNYMYTIMNFDWRDLFCFDGYEEEEGDVRAKYEDLSYEDYMKIFFEPCDYESDLKLSDSSISSYADVELQRTILIIKPEAMVHRDTVLRVVSEAGLQITGRRFLHLTSEQASEIYKKYYGTPSFPYLVVSTSAGPTMVLAIAGISVVNKIKQLIAPDGCLKAEWFFPISMRKRFGLQRSKHNVLYSSENLLVSNKENRYFYPDSILEPIASEQKLVADYCELYVNPTLSKGLAVVVKVKPLDPILYLAEWLLTNNTFQPKFPRNVSLSPM